MIPPPRDAWGYWGTGRTGDGDFATWNRNFRSDEIVIALYIYVNIPLNTTSDELRYKRNVGTGCNERDATGDGMLIAELRKDKNLKKNLKTAKILKIILLNILV